MISNTTSRALSFRLRLVVIIIIGIGNICLLIAMCTDHWIKANGEDYVDHVGLWKACSTEVCVFHNQFVYSKILFVFALLFGTSSNIIGILGLVKGLTYLKYLIGRAMLVTGSLAMFGIISATFILASLSYFERIEFGLVFGWLSAVLYLVAGVMSLIHNKIEPDIAMTVDEIRQLTSARNTPSYTRNP